MKPRTLGFCALAICSFIGLPALGASDEKDWPCYSIRESKLRGAFVSTLKLEPPIIEANGRRIVVKEAWIEKRLARGPVLGLMSIPVSGYRVCLAFESKSVQPDSLSMSGSKVSFTSLGFVIMYSSIEKLESDYSLEYHVGNVSLPFKASATGLSVK